jgi:putative ABC transport system permease protein
VRVETTAFAGRSSRGTRSDQPPSYRTCEVIGIVRDAIYADIFETDRDCIFLPMPANTKGTAQSGISGDAFQFQVRTQGDPRALIAQIRSVIESAGGFVERQIPLAETLSAARSPAVVGTMLAGALGLLAVALAAVGLFGVISFNVSRRTREIGIRVALGATPGVVVRSILRDGLRLIGLGIVFGLLGGYAVARIVTGFIHGVSPLDPLAIGGASCVLVVISLGACYLPARRAATVSPMLALRSE